jgi:hypothetical protein
MNIGTQGIVTYYNTTITMRGYAEQELWHYRVHYIDLYHLFRSIMLLSDQ